MKEAYLIPITSTIFTNNHFKLIKDIFNRNKEVVIFLLQNKASEGLSFTDQVNLIEKYFNSLEMAKINVKQANLKDNASIIKEIEQNINLLHKNENNIHLIINASLKELILKNNLIKLCDIKYIFNNFNQKRFLNDEELACNYPITDVNINDLLSYKLNLGCFNYILEHNLLFTDKIKQFIKDARYKHSVSVANLAYKVAEANNLEEPSKYFITAVLHDIGKHVNNEDSLKIMSKYFKEYVNMPKFAYHQYVGAYICYKTFNIKDTDVLKAICDHCTGNINMSALSKIIYACDKIDPLRGYDSSDMINSMMKNYESGFLYVCKENLIFLKNQTKLDLEDFDEVSKKFFKFYLK